MVLSFPGEDGRQYATSRCMPYLSLYGMECCLMGLQGMLSRGYGGIRVTSTIASLCVVRVLQSSVGYPARRSKLMTLKPCLVVVDCGSCGIW